MKKIIIMFILIGISMSACVSETTNQTTTNTTTSTEAITTPFTEELTTTTQTTTQEVSTTLTTTLFVPVDSATIESDQAIFNVQINTVTIDDSLSVVTVVVKITAKVIIDQELGTSSYGDEGLIGIRIISIDNDETSLYSEFYDIPVTHDILDVHLDVNDSLTRAIQFARMPFHGGAGGEFPSPTGTYKVQVALFTPAMSWMDTGLYISVL